MLFLRFRDQGCQFRDVFEKKEYYSVHIVEKIKYSVKGVSIYSNSAVPGLNKKIYDFEAVALEYFL